MINYSLTKSRRKTISIQINSDATVTVKAPLWASQTAIDSFVSSKQAWIQSHLAKQKALLNAKSSFSLQYGDCVLYRGKEYPIVASSNKKATFSSNTFSLPDNLTSDEIKQAVVGILKAMAKPDFKARALHFAGIMGVSPTAVKLSQAVTNWGSCSGKNSINLSWRLVFAPDAVIDYVIIHELAHIKEHNHSTNFWNIVASFCPNYNECRQTLKQLHHRLQNENW